MSINTFGSRTIPHSPTGLENKMNSIIVLVLGVSVLQPILALDPSLNLHWAQFKLQHGKSYAHDAEEEMRRENFESNVKAVAEHNALFDAGLVSYTKSAHHYHADKSYEELKRTVLGTKTSYAVIPPTDMSRNFSSADLPASRAARPLSTDWRSTRVTSVKSQGSCGSCWTYSTVGAVEGQLPKQNKKLVDLSMQQLVDCAKGNEGGDGCNGGWPQNAFKYVKNNGLQTLASYPYEEKQSNCRYNAGKVVDGTRITGYVDVAPQGDENAVADALASIGPLSVAIHVSDDMMHYKSGIYTEKNCSKEVNHGVLLVGYGSDKGEDFWIMKNSWGTWWGEQGYIRMKKNADNMCAIATHASYPKV